MYYYPASATSLLEIPKVMFILAILVVHPKQIITPQPGTGNEIFKFQKASVVDLTLPVGFGIKAEYQHTESVSLCSLAPQHSTNILILFPPSLFRNRSSVTFSFSVEVYASDGVIYIR